MGRPELLRHLVLRESIHALLEIAVAPRTSAGEHRPCEEEHPDREQMLTHSSHDLGWSLGSCLRFTEQ